MAITETMTALGDAAIIIQVMSRTGSSVRKRQITQVKIGIRIRRTALRIASFGLRNASSRLTEPRDAPMTIIDIGIVAPERELKMSTITFGTDKFRSRICGPRRTRSFRQVR